MFSLLKKAVMGYSTLHKGNIFYDQSSNKFRISRNVIFLENQYFLPTHVESSFVSPILPTFDNF